MLQSVGLQRVGHDGATERQQRSPREPRFSLTDLRRLLVTPHSECRVSPTAPGRQSASRIINVSVTF